jgi:hypothetical protein
MTRSPWTWVSLSGLAYFIPLPFVDDWAARRALRRALMLDGHDDVTVLDTLTEDRGSLLAGCLRTAIVWPIKKLFKTVLWFLTVKEVVDRMAWAAQVVAFAREAREAGWLPERAGVVRDAMEVAFARTNWSPVTRVLTLQPRPPLPEAPEAAWLARGMHGLRRHGGGAILAEKFRERAAAELTAYAAPVPPPVRDTP